MNPLNSLTLRHSRREFLAAAGMGAAALLLRPFDALGRESVIHDFPWLFPFRIDGGKLVVPIANYKVPGRTVKVTKTVSLQIDPADVLTVRDEELLLANVKPSGVFAGTMLKGTMAATIGAFHSLIEEGLVVRDASGRVLTKGTDYLVSAPFALLGIGPNPSVTPTTKVYASYSYYEQRIDTVAVDERGVPHLLRGTSELAVPAAPAEPNGATAIVRIYRPFHGTALAAGNIFPISASAADVKTATTTGRIPKTLGKLQRGEPATILCWGDSITVGADVKPEDAWANRLRVELAQAFPQAQITHKNHSIGGSKTAHWLNNGIYPGLAKKDPAVCRFELVLNDKPDLVVMEFLNDIVLQADARAQIYLTIGKEFRERGIEWVIVTPSHIIPGDLDLAAMRNPAPRPLDSFLQQFANEHGYALADAAARWRHLHEEGIPYFALMQNCYNHPSDKGHRLFVEEIMKCFHA